MEVSPGEKKLKKWMRFNIQVIDGDEKVYQKAPKDKRWLVFFEEELVCSLDKKPSNEEVFKMVTKIVSNDVEIYRRREKENRAYKEQRQLKLETMIKVL